MTVGSQNPVETPDGFLVGTDPRTPPMTAAEAAQIQQETMAGGNNVAGVPTVQITEPAPQQQSRFYTDEDLARVRQEEKEKLYGRLNQMDEQLKSINSEREAAEAAAKAEAEAAKAEAKRKEEEQMEVRDLLARKEQEWQERLTQVEGRYEQDRAVFEAERRFQALEQYRNDVVAQNSEYIMPELRDLISGSDESAIDASVEQMKQRTAAIMSQVAGNVQQQRQDMRGSAPTAPPVGPMEQMQQYESITPQDIASMDMETYKQHRQSLLQAASRGFNNPR